jgi:hypothetical protein
MGQITFYAENGCIGELGTIQDTPGQWINLHDENNTRIPNNKIRSCKLSNVRGRTVIRLYDSPIGDTSYDWARIEVKDVEKKDDMPWEAGTGCQRRLRGRPTFFLIVLLPFWHGAFFLRHNLVKLIFWHI